MNVVQKKRRSWPQVAFVVWMAGWLGTGCASYNKQTKEINRHWEQGNFQTAAKLISPEAENQRKTKDAVIWTLEQGAVLRAAGKLEESNHAFDIAENRINHLEQKAKIKLSRETLASVTNLTALPYEGYAYDKIMMNTYKALNYLELGEYEEARIELNRAYERQKEAVYINAARIEKAQEEGRMQNMRVDLEKIHRNEVFRNQYGNAYSNLERFEGYADYVNPLTVYLDALFFMTRATGGSDLERSRKSFERVLGMTGENTFIRQDLEMVQQTIEGHPMQPTTYIIFETGLAPEREQVRIDLPLFLITPHVPYVGAAFPQLRYRDNYIRSLTVHHDKETDSTLQLSNMDAIITREFKNVLPLIITKTIIASAVKAGSVYAASTAIGGKDNRTAGIMAAFAGAIYEVAVNQADLRTWTTLPKEFQFCRFPTPEDRKIELIVSNSLQRTPVTINEGTVTVVWIKAVNRTSPLLVRQFTLLENRMENIADRPTSKAAASRGMSDENRI
ncbi:MAG: hypothetical protein E3K32_01760 [wastewater metagenome]|nr:hypothetical protein [Candidatus Loosdrechtia aerotolerans]